MKRSAGDIIILHMCTKNLNHMRYGSPDTDETKNLENNNLENKKFEKMKKTSADVFILHMCTKNHDHMMYAS